MKNHLILLSLFIAIISCKKESKKTITNSIVESTSNYIVKNGKHCFISVIENKILKGKDTILEKDYLRINLEVEDKKVGGQYNFTPSNGSVNEGNFIGLIDNNIITSIYTYTQNNKIAKEEIIFKLEENQISVLGGEKEERDGIYYFKDKSQGVYMIQIPKVNCE